MANEKVNPQVTEVEVAEVPASRLDTLLEKWAIYEGHPDLFSSELEIVNAQIEAEQARVNVTSKAATILDKAKVGKATTFKVEDLALALAVAPLFADNDIAAISFTKGQVAAYPDMVALISEAGLKRATLLPKTREDGSTYWDMRASKTPRAKKSSGNPGGNTHKCRYKGATYASKKALADHLGIEVGGASARVVLEAHNIEFEDVS